MATTFYSILGLEPSASAAEIRIAYKRLAMQYHPDKNPGSAAAEEAFKQINEAYHVLSDPLKKTRYDNLINPQGTYTPPVENWREANRRRFWQWKQAQQQPYVIDKNYFKIQGLAFLVFIVIAGFCFALIHTAYYIKDQQRQAEWQANTNAMMEVKNLFINGRFEDALKQALQLKQQDPFEFRFTIMHDSLVDVLHGLADSAFKKQEFSEAITLYRQLQPYEDPSHIEILQRIAMCQYYLGNYTEALQSLKHLHNQDPANLQLVYEISMINLDYLDNPEEAMHYLDLGKKLFKQNLSEVYGDAFMLAVNPKDIPDVYYSLFEARARANMTLENYEEVYHDCNWGIYLRPNQLTPYKLRIKAALQGGRQESLCSDLKNAIRLGDVESKRVFQKKCR